MVVLGAGVAGLVSARVLSKHFETVYLVDKDSLGDSTSSRLEYEMVSKKYVRSPFGWCKVL